MNKKGFARVSRAPGKDYDPVNQCVKNTSSDYKNIGCAVRVYYQFKNVPSFEVICVAHEGVCIATDHAR